MRRARLALPVLLLAFLLAPAVAQPVSIVPGKAIGPIELGMPLERAREIMAGFGIVEAYEGTLGRGFCNPERGVGVCVFDRWTRLNLNSPGVVVFALTDDARFTTEPGGHKVGGALLGILRTFGLYTTGMQTELLWDPHGLSVDIQPTASGLVAATIGIYVPRASARPAAPAPAGPLALGRPVP
ncbi:MAG: hypothetical protein QN183_12400 [Armatimonadota bacterium]|nr:hypothetical protein [Armatimonadota bacterium]MDR7485276.1 hypothetical protein [Armatimonadota bacterium]MDR7533886.1 hypothetical protein [Armatimonadota bacterium]MDR7537152.1 hypothetical protein [Armatimonadota bacterium]